MNFTDSPYEWMMKQVPHGGGRDIPDPCAGCRDRRACARRDGTCRKKYRALVVGPRPSSGQVGPKSH